MSVVAPFTNETVEVVTNVNVAETVLIGNVPGTFYNIEGVGDGKIDSLTNMVQ